MKRPVSVKTDFNKWSICKQANGPLSNEHELSCLLTYYNDESASTYQQIRKSELLDNWKEAMNSEIESTIKQSTWVLVPRNEEMIHIGSK